MGFMLLRGDCITASLLATPPKVGGATTYYSAALKNTRVMKNAASSVNAIRARKNPMMM
jgi:hypothetical protein